MPTPSTSTRARATLVALLAAASLGGCGRHWVDVESTKLQLRLDEYRIVPDAVRVHAGRLKIVAVNVGLLPHDVAVELERPDQHGSPIVIARTATARPGGEVSTKVTLAPGRYRLVDTIANHADLGQYALLRVR